MALNPELQRFWWPVEQYRQVPQLGMKLQTTWSPEATLVTPGPTDSTTPAASWPPTMGKRTGVSPSMTPRSEWQRPAAATLIRTSPAFGSSTSSSTTSNGWPVAVSTAARVFTVRLSSRVGASRVGASQAGNGDEHVLYLQVLEQAGLAALPAVATGLHAPAGCRRRGLVEAVDVDLPGAQAGGQPVGPGEVGGVDVGGQAVVGAVGHPHRFVLAVDRQHRQHRAEALLLGDPAAVVHPGEHGGLHEPAVGQVT